MAGGGAQRPNGPELHKRIRNTRTALPAEGAITPAKKLCVCTQESGHKISVPPFPAIVPLALRAASRALSPRLVPSQSATAAAAAGPATAAAAARDPAVTSAAGVGAGGAVAVVPETRGR